MAGSAATYNVDTKVITGYIGELDSIIASLGKMKTEFDVNFPESFESFMQGSVKTMYDIDGKVAAISDMETNLTNYRNWLDGALQEVIASDDARTEKYQDTGGPSASSSSSRGGSPTTKTPDTKVKAPEKITSPTPDTGDGTKTPTTIDPPTVTTPGGSPGNGNNNGGGTSITPGSGNYEPSGNSSVTPTTVKPFGSDSNYGTSGHSVGASLANGTSGLGSIGNGKSGNSLGSSALGALGKAGDDDKDKSLLDSFSELTSGVSLGDMFGKGIGSSTSILRGKGGRGGFGDAIRNNAGTLSTAAIAMGLAGAGAGAYAVTHSKYYTFDEEDWESLVPSDRNNIIDQFTKAEMADSEVEMFSTSQFRVPAHILDDPAKKLEKIFKQSDQIREDILDRYNFDVYNGKGNVDRYMLFILMTIDGRLTISEKNLYTIINDYSEEDFDIVYAGLQMEDYIYDVEEEEKQIEEQEAY